MDFNVDAHLGNYDFKLQNHKVIGYYGINDDLEMKFDASQLLYYINRDKQRKVRMNLNIGIEEGKPYNRALKNQRLDYLLQWVDKNREKVEKNCNNNKLPKTDFIFRAGLFEMLMATLTYDKSPWVVSAAKWKDIIYLDHFEPQKLVINWRSSQLSSKLGHWSHKFLQYMLADTANGKPNITKIVSQNEHFYCIFQCDLGDNTFVYSSNIHGVCSHKTFTEPLPLEQLEFVKLKMCRTLTTDSSREFFKTATCRYLWGQSVLSKFRKIVIGFRNDQGFIEELQTYTLEDLESILKPYWNPLSYLRFINYFMTQVKKIVVNDCDKTIYKFEKSANSKTIKVTEVSPSSNYAFIPEWYTKNTT